MNIISHVFTFGIKTLLLTACLLFMVFLSSCNSRKEIIEVKVNDVVLKLEVARTASQKEKGLMYRKSLPEKSGMIFVYNDSRVMSFWMKNTMIPLTILFLGKDGTVRDIQHMKASSETVVESRQPGTYAVELNLGEPDKLGIKIGDKFIFPAGFK